MPMRILLGWPLCMLRGIWYTLRVHNGYWVSGHAYVQQPEGPDNVLVLKCENCGHYSISWSHGRAKP